MKLNPFSKKSSAYYNQVKAQHHQLDKELAALNKKLEAAQSDHDREKILYSRICESTGRYSLNATEQEKRQHRVVSEAHNRVSQIEGEISQINHRIAPLYRIVVAPDEFIQAKAALEDLIRQDSALTGEYGKTEVLIAKVEKRITDLEVRIATEMRSAAQTMLSEEGAFVVPESLAKLDMELRLAKTSLDELQRKLREIVTQRDPLPKAIEKAQANFISCRAVVSEIELYEQLMPIMDLFARASVARGQNTYGSYDERRFEIEIPSELVDAAETALVAELPVA